MDSLVVEVIDGLHANVAVIDHQGLIIQVNEGWRNFGSQRNALSDYVGLNYLDTCARSAERGDSDALEVEQGLRRLLDGTAESYGTAYLCAERTFRMTARRLMVPTGGAIIAHEDITALMQARFSRSHRPQRPIDLAPVDRLEDVQEELAQRLTAISLAAGALENGGDVADVVTLIRFAVEEARHELKRLRYQRESASGAQEMADE